MLKSYWKVWEAWTVTQYLGTHHHLAIEWAVKNARSQTSKIYTQDTVVFKQNTVVLKKIIWGWSKPFLTKNLFFSVENCCIVLKCVENKTFFSTFQCFILNILKMFFQHFRVLYWMFWKCFLNILKMFWHFWAFKSHCSKGVFLETLPT